MSTINTFFGIVMLLLPLSFATSALEEQEPGPQTPTGASAEAKKRFVFDPKLKQWFAYDEHGTVVASGKASGGADFCKDLHSECHTIVGEFKVLSRQGPGCKSKKFPIGKGGAKMPYCFFFHGGYAVHGSDHVRDYNASHGCVRIDPKEAEWLYKNFLDIGTTVIIKPYES